MLRGTIWKQDHAFTISQFVLCHCFHDRNGDHPVAHTTIISGLKEMPVSIKFPELGIFSFLDVSGEESEKLEVKRTLSNQAMKVVLDSAQASTKYYGLERL